MKKLLFAVIIGWLSAALLVSPSSANEIDAEKSPLAVAFLVAQRIEDVDFRSEVFADIAARYAKAGQKDKALQILSQVFEAAIRTEDADEKAMALAEIVRGGMHKPDNTSEPSR